MALLNLGTTCEMMGNIDKAIEWHTLVRYKSKKNLNQKAYENFSTAINYSDGK